MEGLENTFFRMWKKEDDDRIGESKFKRVKFLKTFWKKMSRIRSCWDEKYSI